MKLITVEQVIKLHYKMAIATPSYRSASAAKGQGFAGSVRRCRITGTLGEIFCLVSPV